MNERISIAFFDVKPYDKFYFDRENARYNYEIAYCERRLSIETASFARGREAICVFVNDMLDKQTIDALYEYGVRLIALRCAGYNNVDFSAAYKKIHVVRVPAYSPRSVAEYSVAMLMALTRKIPSAYVRTREGNFQLNGLIGRNLCGRTAGVIGTGKIGKLTAEIFKALGMSVAAFDPYPDLEWSARFGISYLPLDELFPECDVLSLHCPLTAQTRHIVDESAIKALKSDAVIINTGRGALIDTRALVEALKNGKIGGAALDVYEEEDRYFYEDWSSSVIRDDVLARLLLMPNVIVSSHQAFLTEEALSSIASVTLENIKTYFSDSALPNEICYKCVKNEDECPRSRVGRCF